MPVLRVDMTLADCIKEYGLSYETYSNAYIVHVDKFAPIALWHCTDYVVSSVVAGCIWLIKRKG
jgi:hypothetical protein